MIFIFLIGMLFGVFCYLFYLSLVHGKSTRGVSSEINEKFPMTIGCIGVGTINSAVVRGLCRASTRPKKILLSPRNAQNVAALKSEFPRIIEVMKSNQAVVDASQWVLVATPPKPEISKRVFSELEFRKEQTVISLIAGISPNTLKNLCGNVKSIVQAFPLPPAELHASTTVMTPINEEVRPLFDCLGKTIAVNEFDLAMKILVCACIMGDFYKQQHSVYEWLVQKGVSSEASTLAVASFFNTFNFSSLQASDGGYAHLVAEQTPGGMNEQAIRELSDAGNYDKLKCTLDNLLLRMTK